MPRVNFLSLLLHWKLCQRSFVHCVSQLCSCLNCASNSCLEIIHSALVQRAACQPGAGGDTLGLVYPSSGLGTPNVILDLTSSALSPEQGDFEGVLGLQKC